jgi:hypothetical protein
MPANQEQIQSAIAAVAQRASKDQAFRQKALEEPVVALNEAGKFDLPPRTPIRFVDKFEKLVIVLPPFGSDPNEITDEEMLGSVSGGVTPVMTTVMIVGTLTLLTGGIYFATKEAPRQG